MKQIIAILLLATLTASAQYRYNLTAVGVTGTNTVVTAYAKSNLLSAVDIAASTRADIILSVKLDGTNSNGTNAFTTTWDSGVDGAHWTNPFTLSLLCNNSNEVWLQTNIWVTNAAYLRLNTATNANSTTARASIKVGNKLGL